MARPLRSFMVSAALASSVFATPVEAAANAQVDAPSYSLYCRGGKPGWLTFEAGGSLTVTAEWGFKHSGAKYNPETLAPGYCAWVDRPMAGHEPWKVFLVKRFSNRWLHAVVRPGRTLLSLRDAKHRISKPLELKALNALGDDNNIVEFRVTSTELDRYSTSGKKYKAKILLVTGVGTIHQREHLQKG